MVEACGSPILYNLVREFGSYPGQKQLKPAGGGGGFQGCFSFSSIKSTSEIMQSFKLRRLTIWGVKRKQ